jgi:hypothetical protein
MKNYENDGKNDLQGNKGKDIQKIASLTFHRTFQIIPINIPLRI